MVDFKKHLVKEVRELLDSEQWVSGFEPWGVAVLGIDPRSAAEVMRDVVMPLMGPVVFLAVGAADADWNRYADPAGPRASQIFSPAVMREQVDPAAGWVAPWEIGNA